MAKSNVKANTANTTASVKGDNKPVDMNGIVRDALNLKFAGENVTAKLFLAILQDDFMSKALVLKHAENLKKENYKATDVIRGFLNRVPVYANLTKEVDRNRNLAKTLQGQPVKAAEHKITAEYDAKKLKSAENIMRTSLAIAAVYYGCGFVKASLTRTSEVSMERADGFERSFSCAKWAKLPFTSFEAFEHAIAPKAKEAGSTETTSPSAAAAAAPVTGVSGKPLGSDLAKTIHSAVVAVQNMTAVKQSKGVSIPVETADELDVLLGSILKLYGTGDTLLSGKALERKLDAIRVKLTNPGAANMSAQAKGNEHPEAKKA